jgi:hypothetical protein
MVEDFPCGKVHIDIGRRYITVYRCDPNGYVLDEERFALPWMIDRKDAVDHVQHVFNMAYHWADAMAYPQSARGGGEGGNSG